MAQNNGKKSFAELPKSGTKNLYLKNFDFGFFHILSHNFLARFFPYTIK